jgi:hypothetical protein
MRMTGSEKKGNKRENKQIKKKGQAIPVTGHGDP